MLAVVLRRCPADDDGGTGVDKERTGMIGQARRQGRDQVGRNEH